MHRLEANPVGFAHAEVEIGVLAIAQRKLENMKTDNLKYTYIILRSKIISNVF